MKPTLHFVLGGGMTEEDWKKLAAYLTTTYKSKIKTSHDIAVYRYTDDVALAIQTNQPTGPVTLAGHSFGGCRAVQTACALEKLGRAVDHLVLFDPVEITAWDRPNTAGFVLPGNVLEAVCFYRGAKEAPYSGRITSGPHSTTCSRLSSTSTWCDEFRFLITSMSMRPSWCGRPGHREQRLRPG